MPYTYMYDGHYTSPNGRRKKLWIVKSPHGRTIAETIGEGTAKLIVEALNQYVKQCSKCGAERKDDRIEYCPYCGNEFNPV